LWLLSNSRLLTRDNLVKRRDVSDPTCVFYVEKESIIHLFLECCVSRITWDIVLEVLATNLGEALNTEYDGFFLVAHVP
jgi:hypothetical protein